MKRWCRPFTYEPRRWQAFENVCSEKQCCKLESLVGSVLPSSLRSGRFPRAIFGRAVARNGRFGVNRAGLLLITGLPVHHRLRTCRGIAPTEAKGTTRIKSYKPCARNAAM